MAAPTRGGERLTVRAARKADLDGMARLLAVLFTQEAELHADARKQRAGLRLILDEPKRGRLFVAEAGGEIVGMVSLLFTVSTFLGSRVALLEDMVVAPGLRGRGIGSRLIEHALDQARRMRLGRITLLTDRTNRKAQRLYERFGFARSSMLPMRRPMT